MHMKFIYMKVIYH